MVSKKEIAEDLCRAKALIADPNDWCQGATRNHLGQHCSLGALKAAGCDTIAHRNALRRVTPECNIVVYNDYHDHACVMEMWDTAIERLENE